MSASEPAPPSSTSTDHPDPDHAEAPKSWWISLLLIGLLALMLRAGWAVAVPVEPTSDPKVYMQFARNIAAGHGYCFEPGRPTAYWAVGPAAFYALSFLAFGETYTPMVVALVVIGSATCVLLAMLGRLWFDARVGLVSGLLMACWPGQIGLATVPASEPLFLFLTVLAFRIHAGGSTSWWGRGLAIGIALAAATYVRPIALLLPIVLAWTSLVGRPDRDRSTRGLGAWKRVFAETLCCLVVMALLIAPWTIRNARVMGGPALISLNAGPNLWMGNHPGADGRFTPIPEEMSWDSELERDKEMRKLALEFIKAEPATFLKLCLMRTAYIHERETTTIAWNTPGLTDRYGEAVLTPLKLIGTLYWYAVLALSVIGVVLLAIRDRLAVLGNASVVILAYFTAVHAVFVAIDRYHYPSVPMIGLLAGFALVEGWTRFIRPRQTKLEAASTAVGDT